MLYHHCEIISKVNFLIKSDNFGNKDLIYQKKKKKKNP